MRVLIAYATEYASTEEIAQRIGRILSEHGMDVDLSTAESAGPAAAYDAFVIGSAVHDRRWLKSAVDLVRRYGSELADRPVWLFSVGMPGALRWPLSRLAHLEEPKLLAQFQPALGPVEHRLWSGVIAPEQLSRTGRLAFRAIGGRYGDYREWPAIEEWAGSIAAALGAVDEDAVAEGGDARRSRRAPR